LQARTKIADIVRGKFGKRLCLVAQRLKCTAQRRAPGEFGGAVARGLAGTHMNVQAIKMRRKRLSSRARGLQDDPVAIAAADEDEDCFHEASTLMRSSTCQHRRFAGCAADLIRNPHMKSPELFGSAPHMLH